MRERDLLSEGVQEEAEHIFAPLQMGQTFTDWEEARRIHDVAVANGWATLNGEVKHQRESDAAFAAASGIAGVGGITNRIIVVSPGADR